MLKRLVLYVKDEEGETLLDKAWCNTIYYFILTICCVILVFIVILHRKQCRTCFWQRKQKTIVYKPKTMYELDFRNSNIRNDVEYDDDDDDESF